ncbi:GH92 family glycosyl hydrolase [Chitinophaga ginsengisoli]|uniref:Putative alpha-1,2-mannosidase n=1 Tax=Chitinophaga ginsengisoli TaxID=363837 RepID=A0A2P8FVS2_9BACT|nr:GH92 family glycosyl hydrolase [Chitinophaga ginsengisoli]PSL25823.1 putative alpha-1,2-mannosidase [Chitinophaga ginsengisoli]
MNVIFSANVRRINVFTGWTIIFSLFAGGQVSAQKKAPVDYVDPFIGTAKSSVFTKWGSEGGTYPGAVAPWGYIQLTPETRSGNVGGYDYSRKAISFFTCLGHNSGFPGGSTGVLQVMPVANGTAFRLVDYQRAFSHADEKASPGYYSVLFRDNNTLVEVTASERTGMFRFTFAAHSVPQIFINDGDPFNAAFHFSEPYLEKQPVTGGYLVKFAAGEKTKQIILHVSVSNVSKESAERNIAAEGAVSFDQLRQDTRQKWAKVLSVVDIVDKNEANKTIFYTALYHAMLMPWIISDVDGNYRERDGKVHMVSGRAAYGGFSPWDTFRSLHPLLSLLYPEKQRDMVLSMLDIYQQTGYLPIESMTGNHAVPIIVDSYLKGVPGIDSALAYAAMKKSIVDTPFIQNDLAVFQQNGYIPFSYPESVTRTVEYAYDDWALAEFAGQIMHNDHDQQLLMKRSYQYRNLFHPQDMFTLPRQGNEFKTEPGNTGYKEGDKWVYSYFAPQHTRDLVNLMGGDKLFTERLDTAMSHGHITFDNETVFHVPYLFNAANAPHKTQQWVRNIMQTRFKATPGGLPGNDDLGSTSSWYVLSAMGIYPVCPGWPEYTVGVPAFDTLRIHLQHGRDFVIKRTHVQYPYIKSLTINHRPYSKISIPHALIAQGGEMVFDMDASPANKWLVRDTSGRSYFEILHPSVAVSKVEPNDPFYVRFSVQNKGSLGTKRVELLVDGKVYGAKNCMAGQGETVTDSIPCRLYRLGNAHITLNGEHAMTVQVNKPDHALPAGPEIKDLMLQALVRKGDKQQVAFTVQNTGWMPRTFLVPLKLDKQVLMTEKITLEPGQEKTLSREFPMAKEGWHTVSIADVAQRCKVYTVNKDAVLLDLSTAGLSGHLLSDSSGLGNHGHILGDGGHKESGKLLLGKDCYVEVSNARSLDVMGTTITMMAWVYPTTTTYGLVDIFTKGDTHVLQVADGRTLTFFAGGWGRGDVTVPLPDNWKDHWHHIAGVCDGDSLKIYIDGELKGFTIPEGHANLSVSNKWTLGRNEEFPFQRIFNGYMDEAKVFATPLSGEDIKEIYHGSAYRKK